MELATLLAAAVAAVSSSVVAGAVLVNLRADRRARGALDAPPPRLPRAERRRRSLGRRR